MYLFLVAFETDEPFFELVKYTVSQIPLVMGHINSKIIHHDI